MTSHSAVEERLRPAPGWRSNAGVLPDDGPEQEGTRI